MIDQGAIWTKQGDFQAHTRELQKQLVGKKHLHFHDELSEMLCRFNIDPNTAFSLGEQSEKTRLALYLVVLGFRFLSALDTLWGHGIRCASADSDGVPPRQY